MTADPWQQLCVCSHALVDHNLGVVPSGPRDCAHEDCDCALDCPECKAEGIDRPDLMDELVRISQGPHPNPGDER